MKNIGIALLTILVILIGVSIASYLGAGLVYVLGYMVCNQLWAANFLTVFRVLYAVILAAVLLRIVDIEIGKGLKAAKSNGVIK